MRIVSETEVTTAHVDTAEGVAVSQFGIKVVL